MQEVNSTEELDLTGIEVAVIGMAGRFPGAADINEFWENLKKGVEAISFFSTEELEESGCTSEILQNPFYIRAQDILPEVEYFDSYFFGYTPKEAEVMDPQMRLFHECIWEAMEDGGYVPGDYNGRIGLYAGGGSTFYWEAITRFTDIGKGIDAYSRMNLSSKDFLCSRISYKLDLKGPVLSVNTACSTSLVAIHLAVQALLNGECQMALAGGVQVAIPHKTGYLFEKGMIYSADGHCRAFDEKAQGTVGGSGAAVVLLKLLEEAVEQRDHIYAVVKGTAINNDGVRKVGFQAPSIEGQAEVIRTALYTAEVEPESVSYIEAQGIGTELGDPVEIEALKLAYITQPPHNNHKYCAIGSVKTNIGHLDCAAGAAGFIKTVLALNHRVIPPSLHFESPNPKLELENSPFFVNTRLMPWKSEEYPLRAGVSSFGIGGTNAHAILEEWPVKNTYATQDAERSCAQLILLSARTPSALKHLTNRLVMHLSETQIDLENLAFTLQTGRKHFENRKMIAVNSLSNIIKELSNPDSLIVHQFTATRKNPPVVFMFPGDRSWFPGVSWDIYQKEPYFSSVMDTCITLLEKYVEIGIKNIIYPQSIGGGLTNRPINMQKKSGIETVRPTDSGETEKRELELAPLIMFALEYSLGKVLMNWGVKPYAMIGHGIGEFVAACLAGVFSLEDAIRLIIFREKIISKFTIEEKLEIELSENEVEKRLKFHNNLSLSEINDPARCVVTGTGSSLALIKAELEKEGIRCELKSKANVIEPSLLDSAVEQFVAEVAKINLKIPDLPYLSTVSGDWISIEEATDPKYWGQQLKYTIRFSDCIEKLVKDESMVFVEVGPGNILNNYVSQQTQENKSIKIISLLENSANAESESNQFLGGIGYLWLYGVDIDWLLVHEPVKPFRVSLPTYPFERIQFKIPVNPFSKVEVTGKKHEPYEAIIPMEALTRSKINALYLAPELNDKTSHLLVKAWEHFFGVTGIGINDSFFDLGGDSLKAMNLLAGIHKQLNVKIPMDEFFKLPTIAGQVQYINGAQGSVYSSIQPVEKKEFYPLSSAQKRMYFVQQIDKESLAYNVTMALNLEGTYSRSKLEDLLNRLINRHESLKTFFPEVNSLPVQRIQENMILELKEFNLEGNISTEKERTTIVERFVRPFDINHAPLMRAGIIFFDTLHTVLMLDMHHIVLDGTSINILTKEFHLLNEGKHLPELRIQFKEYVEWERWLKKSEAGKKQEEYWLNEFSGDIPVLELPTDYPRPAVQKYNGGSIVFEIQTPEVQNLKEVATSKGVTLYMLLLAMFNVFLSRLSNQEEIVVGTPSAGRSHVGLEQVVGMFVNTLALRNVPNAEKSFIRLLAEVKTSTLAAFENQGFQYEELVEKVVAGRDPSRNPLFDVMLILQNIELGTSKNTHSSLEATKKERTISKFDLTLEFHDTMETLLCIVEYSTNLFKRETIRRYIGYFKRIISGILASPEKPLSQIDILSDQEKEQLLTGFNSLKEEISGERTIQQLISEQVEMHSDNLALEGPALEIRNRDVEIMSSPLKNRFLPEEVSLTYRELEKSSNRMANYLIKEKGIRTGDRILVVMERSVELIFTLLGVMKAGAAYVPLDPALPGERLGMVAKDASVAGAVTQHKYENKLYSLAGKGQRGDIFIMSIDEEADRVRNRSSQMQIQVTAGNPAYIMYTSGSSGVPKGVLVEHRTIINTLLWRKKFYHYTPENVSLQVPPYFFDSSVTDIFTPLLGGARLVLVKEEDRVNLEVLKHIIPVKRISHFIVVPVFYNVMLEEISGALTGVKMITCAGENFPNELIRKHFEKIPLVRIFNEYGPTENSVNSTAYELLPNSIKALIGKPISNVGVFLLDRNLQLVPLGVNGEMCLSGASLARGYLNNPELTNDKFCYPNTLYKQKVYRSGDMGRWDLEGNLEYLGRTDSQVKIRGIRIETGEIESQLLKNPGVKEAVVVARQGMEKEKFLCAYIVLSSEDNEQWSNKEPATVLKAFLVDRLPEYMIPLYFIRVERIPFTPSGKINREALPEPVIDKDKIIAPRNREELKLGEIWSQVLGIPLQSIGIDSDFFQLGGHSLKATTAISRIHKAFNVEVPLVEIFTNPTIRGMASFIKRARQKIEIERARQEQFVSIKPTEKKEYYPLSPAQKRLYLLHPLVVNQTVYNLPMVIPFNGKPDKLFLESLFKGLVKRHDSFRTSFLMVNGEPVQRVADHIEFQIEDFCLPQEMINSQDQWLKLRRLHEILAGFQLPFDLSRAPLLRVAIMEEKESYLLLIDIHHIISDAVSHAVLKKDFETLYDHNPGNLPLLKLQYKDFAQWQSNNQQSEILKKQEIFWLNQLDGELPALTLPFDFPVPLVRNFSGKTVTFMLTSRETQTLKSLASKSHTTLFMPLLAVYSVLLAKLSNQEDIIIGTAIAGRRHADLEPIVGMFVNMLPIRTGPIGNIKFRDFLSMVIETALQAFENQEFPFEELVDKLNIKRDTARNPIFSVALNLVNAEERSKESGKPEGKEIDSEQQIHVDSTAKFDITLSAVDRGELLLCSFEYSSALLTMETIDRYISYFKHLLATLGEDDQQTLNRLDIVPTEEKNRILIEVNKTGTAYPFNKTITGLIDEGTSKQPHRIALSGPILSTHIEKSKENNSILDGNVQITYQEVRTRTDLLALQLMNLGVKTEDIVGLIIDRSIEMVIAILGILKSGGAYLPIEPGTPKDRRDFMLKDSSTRTVLTGFQYCEKEQADVLFCDIMQLLYGKEQVNKWETLPTPDNVSQLPLIHRREEITVERLSRVNVHQSLAYIIYTSGSTGKPKGVLTMHYNVSRVVKNTNYINIVMGDRVMQLSNYAFDGSVFDIYGALINGAALVLLRQQDVLAINRLSSLIQKEAITVFFVTTALFNMLVEMGNQSLTYVRKILFGGERVSVEHCRKALAYIGKDRVVHVYGPTEGTVFASFYSIAEIPSTAVTVPIGKPLSNTTLYILDKSLFPVPIGVHGELFVGGTGVARGYLNRPELTQEKFYYLRQGDSFGENSPLISGKRFLYGNSPTQQITHSTLYRTGDLVRWQDNGNVEFLGRIDYQVKIRGYRIELGEIETCLTTHSGIKEAVVINRNEQERHYLCAYFTPEESGNSSLISAQELKKFLEDKLPAYMIPSCFVPVEQIPLNPNGKVQQQKLPLPLESDFHSGGVYKAPETSMQRLLVEIWQEILGREKVGIHDNFFDLGGNSLDIVKLGKRIQDKLERPIPVVNLFTYPTISSLENFLTREAGENNQEEDQSNSPHSELIDEGKSLMHLTLNKFDPGE